MDIWFGNSISYNFKLDTTEKDTSQHSFDNTINFQENKYSDTGNYLYVVDLKGNH